LARLNLPYAEAVFDISYFRDKPEPFYVLAKELYPGRFHPTVSHAFIALLAAKGLLFHLFTQNIDCLERAAGVPEDLIVEAHGSFATQRCIDCWTPYPDDRMREHVSRGEVPRCAKGDEVCSGLVKPDIVFFGEQLPKAFRDRQHYPAMADLVLIMGTSLTVQPFASLPDSVPRGVPRVLFNLERVGNLGCQADDVLCLGDCDAGVRKLADELGWREELEAEWRRVVGEKEAERQTRGAERRDRELEDELSKLADQVDEVLHLGTENADEGGSEEPGGRAEGTNERSTTAEFEGEVGSEAVGEAAPAEEHEGKANVGEKEVLSASVAGGPQPVPDKSAQEEDAAHDELPHGDVTGTKPEAGEHEGKAERFEDKEKGHSEPAVGKPSL
jgi:NAD-dependent histone deacetylase SIR2